MTEILFYHLQRQPIEKVLPTLLEKSIERGWRRLMSEVGVRFGAWPGASRWPSMPATSHPVTAPAGPTLTRGGTDRSW